MNKKIKLLAIALALVMLLSTSALLLSSCDMDTDNGGDTSVNTEGVTDATEGKADKATDKSTEKATDKNSESSSDKESSKETDKPTDNTDDNTGNDSGNSGNEDNNGGTTEEEPATPEAKTPIYNVNGTTKEWSVEEGISTSFTTASNSASTKFEINIPVVKAGSYELKLDVNLGLTRTYTNGTKSATISLPKTVFGEYEPIPVSYVTKGLDTSTGNKPWIGITKNVDGVDKYVTWGSVTKNSSGSLDIRTLTGYAQDASVSEYITLPEGEYKIYFIDEGAEITNTKYWLISEPINISIVSEDTQGTTVKRTGTGAYSNVSLSVMNNTICQGNDVVLKYTAGGLNYNNDKPWVAIGKTISGKDYYSHWRYITSASGSTSFNASSSESAQDEAASYKSLPVGSYKLYFLQGANLNSGVKYIEPIGINIAPKVTIGAKVGTTSVFSTSNPYDVNSISKNITVTAADVEAGYVTVSFDLSNLSANTLYYLTAQNISLVQK